MKKTVGVIGGMGPQATVDFFNKIIKHTPVKKESDHIHLLIDNNPQVPSRIDAVINNGVCPSSTLVDMAKKLESAGAELLTMPCNSAHIFINHIEENINIPVINMISETIKEIAKSKCKKVALLATPAVVSTNLYKDGIIELGKEFVVPEKYFQNTLTDAIMKVKSGEIEHAEFNFSLVLEHILSKGVDAVILGCTELPLIKRRDLAGVHFFDTTEILAISTIENVKKVKSTAYEESYA